MAGPPRHHRPQGPHRAALIILSGLLPLVSGFAEAQTRQQPASPLGKDRRPAAVRKVPTSPLPSQVNAVRSKPLMPVQLKHSPDTYLGRTVRVAGFPSVKLDTATGKWSGITDGLKVEMTPAAKAHYDAMKTAGQRPVFTGQLARRAGELLLIYTGPDSAPSGKAP